MKTLRRICAATILSVTLGVSAFAGHIETPAAASIGSGSGLTTDIVTVVVVTAVSLAY